MCRKLIIEIGERATERVKKHTETDLTQRQQEILTSVLRYGETPEYGGLMRDMRKQTGLTQLDVRELTGVPRTRLSEYENCRRVPSVTSMQKLMNLYEPKREKLEELMAQWEVMLMLHPQATRY